MNTVYQKQPDMGLKTGQDHYERLHQAPHGVVLLWERLGQGKRWHKINPRTGSAPGLLSAHQGGVDRYMSVNEFYGWRVIRQLQSLRSCFVDIDGYTDLEGALEACQVARLPSPTLAVMSGRGIHLYWEIDPVPAQALPVWQRVQNSLIEQLAAVRLPVDVKVKDCTRVLRLVGSKHSKNGHDVHGVQLVPWRWTLHTLADEVLGFRPDKPEPQPQDPRPQAQVRSLDAARVRAGRQVRTSTGSIYDWWHLVYRDLITIGDANLLGIPEGHRDAWLFLYGVSLSWFTQPDSLAAEVEAVARTYTPGLRIAEVRDAIAPTLKKAQDAAAGKTVRVDGQDRDPRYWFKRKTLLEWLGPVIPEDLYPSLRAIIPDQLRTERRDEREHARYADHNTGKGVRASNENQAASARLMRAAGQSIRSIAAELGVSLNTVQRWTE
jgi:hypothetical protein